MFYEWLAPLGDEFQLFNLFNYITFRVGGAIMTSLIICFLIGPKMIDGLRARQGKGQPIREDGPEGHIIKKAGTPTMGGLMILVSLSVSLLLWMDPRNALVWASTLRCNPGIKSATATYRKLDAATARTYGSAAGASARP